MAKFIVQHRRGSAAQWEQANVPIPKEGEIVIELDKVNHLHKLKIGDGYTPYSDLAYLQAGDELVTQVLAKAMPRVITVTLDVNRWVKPTADSKYYYQTIAIDNITTHSKLNLQPDADMLAEFQELNLVFVTENKNSEDGITVYSVGDVPLKSYTMQATIVETEVESDVDKIVGIPVGTPSPNYLPQESGMGAQINYGPGYKVNISASESINLGTGGAINLDSRSGVNLTSEGEYSANFGGKKAINAATPTESTDLATKGYVDDVMGDVEAVLDSIIAMQNSLIGGETA